MLLGIKLEIQGQTEIKARHTIIGIDGNWNTIEFSSLF